MEVRADLQKPVAEAPLRSGSQRIAAGMGQPACVPRAGAVAAARRVLAAGPGRIDGSEGGTLGVVLGTGLGGLADQLEGSWTLSASETGWLVPSTATGHAGRVVCGWLGGHGPCRRSVVMLQGRVHGYEGHAPESLVRGVELLAALGATRLLVTNAAGGLRSDMHIGQLLVVSDHIDLVREPWTVLLETAAGGGVPASTAATFYDRAMRKKAISAASGVGVSARTGVYAHLKGPSYETRAEYRMLRKLGADVVGMSTVPEVVAANRLGLAVAAISVVTNVASPDAPACTDAEDVCPAAAAAAAGVWAMLAAIAMAPEGDEDA